MTKYVLILLGVIVLAVVLLSGASTLKTQSDNQAYISQQETQRIIAAEQTKQDALLLRTEETSRVVNYVAMIVGPVIAIGVIAFLIIIIDNKLAKNRMYEMQQLAAIERNRIRELKHLEAMQQKQLVQPKSTTWYLTGETVDQTPERKVLVYNAEEEY